MKTKFLLIITFLLAFSAVGFAQIKIATKKVDYKRPKTVENENKRSFYIVYPKVAGASGAKIEAILNYEKAFDFKLKEQQSGEDFWLDSCDFVVNYNKNNILGVELYMEGSGAYPSTSVKRFVINTKTATRVKPTDVFVKPDELAAMIKKAQTAEMKKAKEEYKKDADAQDLVDNEYFTNADYKAENLWVFTVSDKGITFHYDYEFPHVILALQPEGNYFYNWTQLKPFIKKDGLFSQFAK
ncbi:MAG: hypothetical protein MUC29_01405 [Pyrinomonadaceae bacterium]|jgi:hypothetical protein|nr:hypothetical protein [Pyrinomonadaceae bacterium]